MHRHPPPPQRLVGRDRARCRGGVARHDQRSPDEHFGVQPAGDHQEVAQPRDPRLPRQRGRTSPFHQTLVHHSITPSNPVWHVSWCAEALTLATGRWRRIGRRDLRDRRKYRPPRLRYRFLAAGGGTRPPGRYAPGMNPPATATATTAARRPRRRPRDWVVDTLLFLAAVIFGLLVIGGRLESSTHAAGLAVHRRRGRRRARLRRAVAAPPLAGRAGPGAGGVLDLLGGGVRGRGGGDAHGRDPPAPADHGGRLRPEPAGRARSTWWSGQSPGSRPGSCS